MPLSEGREAFKAALLAQAANTNEKQTQEQAVDNFIDALEVYLKTATVLPFGVPVPLTAPPSGGPVTGVGSLE